MKPGRVRVLVLAALVVASLPLVSAVRDFDGFEDGDFTSNPEWDKIVTSGSASVQQTTVNSGSFALEMEDYKITHDRGSGTISDGDIYRVYAYLESGADFHYYIANGNSRTSPDSVYINAQGGNSFYLGSATSGGTYKERVALVSSPPANEWLRVDIEINPSQTEANATLYDSQNNVLGTGTISTSGANDMSKITLDTKTTGVKSYFDDVSYAFKSPNNAPYANVSTTPQQYSLNDDVEVQVDASDSDGTVKEVCAEATRTNTTTTQTLNQSCRSTSSSSVTENFNGFFDVSDRGYNYTVNVNATDDAGATATDSKTRTIGNTAFTDAFDVLGDNVGAFNVTIDGTTKTRGNQFITAQSFNATFSKSGFFDKTATFTEGLNNNFTGVGDANVTVLVDDDPSNNTVSNYTATISNNSNGFSENKSTTSGSVSFFAVQNATYNVTADSDTRPFTSRIVNVTSQQQNVTFSLKKERTAELTFKDTTGNSVITQQVNYTLTPTNINASVVSGDTSTGSANETLLEPASYRGQAESSGFEPNTFFFTIRDESINDKTVYLTDKNKTSPITVTVLDQATNPVSGVKVRLQRFYTNTSSYNTITSSQTDSEGQTTLFPPADRAYYKFTFNRNNDLLKITDPLQLLKATYQFTVSLGETQLTESNAYNALSTELRYDNATSDFKATIDQSGENNKACLKTERTGALRTTRLNKTCTTSTTATLILPRGQANDTYTATVTYQTSKSTFEVDTLTKSFGDETPATTTGVLGQLILTLIVSVPVIALLPSISPVIIASTIALGWWIGLTTIGLPAVMAILVTGVTATIAARKR